MRPFLLSAIAVAVPLSLYAQAPAQTTSISGDPACATCRIEVTRLFTVGEIPGAATGRDSRIVRDSSGHYLVVVEPGPRIAVVDSTGRFIRFHNWRSIRADPSARGVAPLIDMSGWAHVFDGATQWHFDSAGSAICGLLPSCVDGSETFRDAYSIMGVMGLGGLLVTAPSTLPHPVFAVFAGWYGPLLPARIDSHGFARDSLASSNACRDCNDIVLSVSLEFSKGTLWTASADRYRINLFDYWGTSSTGGNPWAQAIEVAASWLPTRDSSEYRRGRTLPEAPRITGLWFDQNGCTILMSAAERAALGRTDCERRLWVSGLTIRDASASDEGARYRTVIDVVGATALRQLSYASSLSVRPRMIARVQLLGRVELFGAGLVYQHRALPNGGWALDVFRLSVVD